MHDYTWDSEADTEIAKWLLQMMPSQPHTDLHHAPRLVSILHGRPLPVVTAALYCEVTRTGAADICREAANTGSLATENGIDPDAAMYRRLIGKAFEAIDPKFCEGAWVIAGAISALAMSEANRQFLWDFFVAFRQVNRGPLSGEREFGGAISALCSFHILVQPAGDKLTSVETTHHSVFHLISERTKIAVLTALIPFLMRRLRIACQSPADSVEPLVHHACIAAEFAVQYPMLQSSALALQQMCDTYRAVVLPDNIPTSERITVAMRKVGSALKAIQQAIHDELQYPYPHGLVDRALAQYRKAEKESEDALRCCFTGEHDIELGRPEEEDLDALLREESRWAFTNAPEFLTAVSLGDETTVRELLCQSKLLASVGRLDDSHPQSASCRIIAENVYQDDFLDVVVPPLPYHEHLRVWAELSEVEMTKLHGLDWERTSVCIRLPLLQAVEKGQVAIAQLLLDNGASAHVCSPHDMRTPLSIAISTGNEALVQLLLPYSDVLYAPPYVLSALPTAYVPQPPVVRAPCAAPNCFQLTLAAASADKRVPLARMAQEEKRTGNRKLVMHFLQVCAIPIEIVRNELQAIAVALSDADIEDMKYLFGCGAPYESLLEQLLLLVSRVSERSAAGLLQLLPKEKQHRMLTKTDDLRVLVFLLRFAGDVGPNVVIRDRPLVLHHIAAGHREVLLYLLRHGVDHTYISEEGENLVQYAESCRRPELAQLLTKWRDHKLFGTAFDEA
eukprot:TRINITY_DN4931_c0_g1_i1.p1 TRINITY_DN4931_c0_g1~~TRINITY_DN4931_c0_g1_i1.p1  ORF type:complete len:735 (+),score=101.07 TRINITY_DN4931_c0_g1_i1:509-2713(+)